MENLLFWGVWQLLPQAWWGPEKIGNPAQKENHALCAQKGNTCEHYDLIQTPAPLPLRGGLGQEMGTREEEDVAADSWQDPQRTGREKGWVPAESKGFRTT